MIDVIVTRDVTVLLFSLYLLRKRLSILYCGGDGDDDDGGGD